MSKQGNQQPHTPGDFGGDDRPNRIPWPPVILLSGLAGGWLMTRLYPLPWIGGEAAALISALGGLLIAGALAIMVLCFLEMQKANTTILPHRGSHALVTSGPFAISRNPIYVADVMLISGTGLLTGSLWYLPFAIIAGVLIDRLAIPGEERHLEHHFGKRYRDYRKKVRRWI